MANTKEIITNLLKEAGIEINGPNTWDIQVYNEAFYKRVLSGGRLALGESYMDGWWDVEKIDEFIFCLLREDIHKKIPFSFNLFFLLTKARLSNLQSVSRAKQVGEEHYDIGNDLYKAMLDKRMMYTCGYWQKGAKNLDEAQEAKLALTVKKLDIKPGMRVLDIGCGWGGLAKYITETCDVKEVVGITISKEQKKLALENIKGLPIDIRVQDYRAVEDGPFDRIVSLGMFEHVGYKNYRTYMEKASELLTDDGLFLLHTIGSNTTVYVTDPWFDKYIFPNGMLPSITQLGKATEELFVMEDWENFGADYDKTAMAWWGNFDKAWPDLKKSGKYNDRFYRMWKYYLCSVVGDFRSRRNNQLWQILLSKKGVIGGVNWVR